MRHRRRHRPRPQSQRRWLVWGSVFLLVGALLPSLIGQLWLNLGSLATLQSLLGSPAMHTPAEQRLTTALAWHKPQAYWLLGWLAAQRQDEAARQRALAALLAERPNRLPLLRIVAADAEELAQQAVTRYPAWPEALAWRADQLVEREPAQAIQLYSQALRQDPIPYDWWLGLGRAYVNTGNDQAALLAYERGCALAWGVLPCHELQQLRQRVQKP